MYEAFYSLDDSPFVLTPDPRFLLRSKGHHEILATLLYGVTSQKGLMALVGDVGTGKTTLCRTLLRDLPDTVQSALVLNPHLSGVDLIDTLLDDLGVEHRPSATKGELMSALSQYLLAAGAAGKTVLVIVDEAQRMSVESLEQIRILSNLETPTRKLVQILLVGQPELERSSSSTSCASSTSGSGSGATSNRCRARRRTATSSTACASPDFPERCPSRARPSRASTRSATGFPG